MFGRLKVVFVLDENFPVPQDNFSHFEKLVLILYTGIIINFKLMFGLFFGDQIVYLGIDISDFASIKIKGLFVQVVG